MPKAVQEYSYEEREKWKKGAAAYRQFASLNTVRSVLTRQSQGELQALFLREKPAVCKLPNMEVLKKELPRFGFSVAGDYAYDREQTQKIIDDHRELFMEYGATSADEVMEKLSKEDLLSASIIRGLVLGYPMKSVEGFERATNYRVANIVVQLHKLLKTDPEKQLFLNLNFFTEHRANNTGVYDFIIEEMKSHADELGISSEDIPELSSELKELIDAKRVNVNGYGWVEYGDDPDSAAQQKRLQEAFENSGILSS